MAVTWGKKLSYNEFRGHTISVGGNINDQKAFKSLIRVFCSKNVLLSLLLVAGVTNDDAGPSAVFSVLELIKV